MSNLLVSIPTRNRPEGLLRTLQMLYATYEKRDNFDIQVIIDDDQVDLYQPVTDDYPEVIWTFTKYAQGSWLNLVNAQHELLFSGNYYFTWMLPDDMFGLQKNWDTAIITKAKTFQDDLFVLYTKGSRQSHRNPETHASCYTVGPGNHPEYLDLHEPDPVWTKKWGEFIAPLFYGSSKYVVYRELIIAGILRLLYLEHGENRNVECSINYDSIENHHNSEKLAKCWVALMARDYDDLRVVATRMKEYIDSRSQQ